jgi:hypothetical protein
MNLSRAAYYREENKFAVRDAPVVEAVIAVVAQHGRWGFGNALTGCGWKAIRGITSVSGGFTVR